MMRAKVTKREYKYMWNAENLHGADTNLPFASAGATINNILSAVLANGTTTLSNAAKEPHIVDVSNFLKIIEADITGSVLTKLVEKLSNALLEKFWKIGEIYTIIKYLKDNAIMILILEYRTKNFDQSRLLW